MINYITCKVVPGRISKGLGVGFSRLMRSNHELNVYERFNPKKKKTQRERENAISIEKTVSNFQCPYSFIFNRFGELELALESWSCIVF